MLCLKTMKRPHQITVASLSFDTVEADVQGDSGIE